MRWSEFRNALTKEVIKKEQAPVKSLLLFLESDLADAAQLGLFRPY